MAENGLTEWKIEVNIQSSWIGVCVTCLGEVIQPQKWLTGLKTI